MLRMSANDKIEQDKMILILSAGIALALKEKAITLEEAEDFLFSPYSAVYLEKKGYSKEIVKIIDLGGELENVLSLIPDSWDWSLDDIINRSIVELQKRLATSSPRSKKWIDKL